MGTNSCPDGVLSNGWPPTLATTFPLLAYWLGWNGLGIYPPTLTWTALQLHKNLHAGVLLTSPAPILRLFTGPGQMDV